MAGAGPRAARRARLGRRAAPRHRARAAANGRRRVARAARLARPRAPCDHRSREGGRGPHRRTGAVGRGPRGAPGRLITCGASKGPQTRLITWGPRKGPQTRLITWGASKGPPNPADYMGGLERAPQTPRRSSRPGEPVTRLDSPPVTIRAL